MKTVHALSALILAVVTALSAALPASAEDGIRKTGGGGYAVQISGRDLSQPGDRQAVLQNIKTAARNICAVREKPLVLRRACQKEIVSNTIAYATPAIREALQLALTEHNGIPQQAMR